MKHVVKLILNQTGYPHNFEKHCVNIAQEQKQLFFEQKIINSLNHVNSKLKIESVEYSNLNSEFKDNFLKKYSGLIVKELEIDDAQKKHFEKEGYQIRFKDSKLFATMVTAYVFLSVNKEEFRDTLFTQSIFPDILDSMNLYLDSPSYTILNHPIYFIDVIDKKITAPTLIRRLALMIASGFHYVEIFNNQTIIPSEVPTQIVPFMRKYELDNKQTPYGYETDYLNLNFNDKSITIKDISSRLIETNNGNLAFHGSDDKFFFFDILFITYIAVSSGFTIHLDDYKEFLRKNQPRFTKNSDKMTRCIILLHYFEKLSLKK